MASIRCCLVWLGMTQLLMTCGSDAGPQLPSDDVLEAQFSCMADYLHSKDRQRVDVYVQVPLSDRQLSRLLQLLSDRLLFARLRRGSPAPALKAGPSVDIATQVMWLVPDTDSNATSALFTRVRRDDRHRWLLVSLTGRRRDQFLEGYAARHSYMIVRNGTTRFHSARDFHRGRRLRGVCRGGRYERRRRGAGVELGRRAMEGVRLRVPYAEADNDLTTPKLEVLHQDGIITGGFIGSLILILQNQLGFSYTLQPVYAVGNITAWDHAVQMLHQDRGDMFGGRLMITNTRRTMMDFSIPLLTELAGAAIDRRHTLALTEFLITQPLEMAVWRALLGIQLLAVFVLCLIAHCQRRIRQVPDEPSNDVNPSFWALMVLGVSCQQGPVVRSDAAASYRLAITALYLISLFILACYSGNLLAEMTLARHVNPFDNLPKALKQGWQVSGSGTSLAVQERIVQPLMGRDIDGLKLVAAGPLEGRIIQMASSSISDFVNNCTDLGHDEICPVCLWPGAMVRIPVSLSFRRNFPYLRLFNYHLQQLHDRGIISRELHRWTSRSTQDVLCPVGTMAPLQMKPLGLSNLKHVVSIVGFGLLGSGAVLLCEWLMSLFWDCYVTKSVSGRVVNAHWE